MGGKPDGEGGESGEGRRAIHVVGECLLPVRTSLPGQAAGPPIAQKK